MEVVVFAFALGAGTVVAVKHGGKIVKRAIGWTAQTAGWISGRATAAIDDARRTARDEFLRGRERQPPRSIGGGPPSSRSPAAVSLSDGAGEPLQKDTNGVG
jgi:hypothetical protein